MEAANSSAHLHACGSVPAPTGYDIPVLRRVSGGSQCAAAHHQTSPLVSAGSQDSPPHRDRTLRVPRFSCNESCTASRTACRLRSGIPLGVDGPAKSMPCVSEVTLQSNPCRLVLANFSRVVRHGIDLQEGTRLTPRSRDSIQLLQYAAMAIPRPVVEQSVCTVSRLMELIHANPAIWVLNVISCVIRR